MANTLTRSGAREVTLTLDRIASVIQENPGILGLNPKIAMDFARRCDFVSDFIEIKASGNSPRSATDHFDPAIIGEEQAGPLEEIDAAEPFMDGHFTQKNFDELDAAQEDGELGATPYITKSGAKELTSAIDRVASVIQGHHDLLGLDKKIASDFAYRCDLISDAVEKAAAGTHFDPAVIAEEVPGPEEQPMPEESSYMDTHFTQKNFNELDTAQTSGSIGVPSYITDTFKAASDISAAKNPESLKKAVASLQEILKKAAAPDTNIGVLPGFSPMQIRAEVDRIAKVHQELVVVQKQFEDALARIKGLEDEEAKGLALLKKAAGQLDAKGNFLLEAQTALLKFSAKFQPKTPGLEQIMAHPDDVKDGEKAGNLVGRISEKLGVEVAAAVAEIIAETKADLTHTTLAISGLKIVAKSASVPASHAKQAGLTDIVVSMKEWLSGKADRVAQHLLNFVGDVGKWFKGFAERTKSVQKNTDNLVKMLSKAEGDLEQIAKSASVKPADKFHGFNLTK